jgi:hypothetical protein
MNTSVSSGFLLGRMGDNAIGTVLDLIDRVEDCDGSFFGVLCEKAFADEVIPLLVVAEGEADNSGTSFSVFSLFLLEVFAEESP